MLALLVPVLAFSDYGLSRPVHRGKRSVRQDCVPPVPRHHVDVSNTQSKTAQHSACSVNPQMVASATTCKGPMYNPYWTAEDKHEFDESLPLRDKCSLDMPECSIGPIVRKATVDDIALVLVMTMDEGKDRVGHVIRMFKHMLPHANVRSVLGVPKESLSITSKWLEPGEIAYRLAMRKALETAQRAGLSLIVDDDVMIHTQFFDRLRSLFDCPRCTCHLVPETNCTQGLLQLGSTILTKASWAVVESDRETSQTPCANVVPGVWGSFATLYSPEIIPSILQWLDNYQRFPFDYVYSYLARERFVTRLALPFLSVADIAHKSSVKERIYGENGESESVDETLAKLRWNMADYV